MIGAFYAATSGMRTDLQVILTRQTDREALDAAREKIDELRAKTLSDNLTGLKDQITASDKRFELLRLEFQ